MAKISKEKKTKKTTEVKKKEVGKVDISSMLAEISTDMNNTFKESTFMLDKDDPTIVKKWIKTGSTILDSILVRGSWGGIPSGKVIEIAGLPGTGKSYFAALIAANSIKQGIIPVYIDSERAIGSDFIKKLGVDVSKFFYVHLKTLEDVTKYVEKMLTYDLEFMFILDSLAFTPTKKELEMKDADAGKIMGIKARTLTLVFNKLLGKLKEKESSFLILNHLRKNIDKQNPMNMLVTPYNSPGGLAIEFACSYRIWITKPKSKSNFIIDENGFKIGNVIKIKVHKSRFGTEGRECKISIIWGDDKPRILDKASWFDAVEHSEYIRAVGRHYELIYADGSVEEFKFTKTDFYRTEMVEKLETNKKFRNRFLELIEEEQIRKFKDKDGKSSNFYDIESKKTPKKQIDDFDPDEFAIE